MDSNKPSQDIEIKINYSFSDLRRIYTKLNSFGKKSFKLMFEHLTKNNDIQGKNMFIAHSLSELEEKLILEEKSGIDHLTGLKNRKGLEEDLEKLIRRFNREIRETDETQNNSSRGELCLMYVDVDDFKGYNDRFGHHEGDNVLKDISRIFSNCIRKGSDEAYRVGGDEFIISFEGPMFDAIKLGELIRDRLKDEINIIHYNDRLHLTNEISLSIGVTCYNEGDTKEELIRRADKKMYEIKNSGKGRIPS